MRFLFRLDLSLQAGAEFFFGILNFATKQGDRSVLVAVWIGIEGPNWYNVQC